MFGKLISTVSAAALLLAVPIAGPASADDDDLVKVLAGITAIAVVGKAIEESNAQKAAKAAANAEIPEAPEGCRGARWDGARWVNTQNVPCLDAVEPKAREANPAPQRQAVATPSVCLREQWQEGRTIKYFDKTCMQSLGFRLTTQF